MKGHRVLNKNKKTIVQLNYKPKILRKCLNYQRKEKLPSN